MGDHCCRYRCFNFLSRIFNAFIFSILLIFFSSTIFALEFPLPKKGDSVVGELKLVYSEPGDTIALIARRYDVGYLELMHANPNLDSDRELLDWTKVMIPTRYILPPGPRKGVVINLAELRLYYYPPNKNVVVTAPVGIGKISWDTPEGTTRIRVKVVDPIWYPPESVRKDAASLGHPLPRVVPAGPENPLGRYAMKLGWPSYLIHSTNRPEGVGRRSSAGCIRMYPEDAESFFDQVAVNTKVRVINRPFKVGLLGEGFYLEAHPPLQEHMLYDGADLAPVVGVVVKGAAKRPIEIDWLVAKEVAKQQLGIPHVVGFLHRRSDVSN